jgi:hypothetical protein
VADPTDPSNWGEYSEDQDGFMKRQRGRGRKPGGGGGGGGGSHNHGNRSIESNGPEVKIRGTAAQIYEKYSQYARDAQSAGDRVKYENLLQHAEHYFRIMVATMPRERLFQQQGEGGMPMQPHGLQQGGEGGQSQPGEGGVQGETGDPMKVMDDMSGEDDGEEDSDIDREDDRDSDSDQQLDANNSNEDRDNQQGDRQGRRRRRGRRRHPDNPQAASGNNPDNNTNNGNDNRDQPRSALDSLARRQGAIAGS